MGGGGRISGRVDDRDDGGRVAPAARSGASHGVHISGGVHGNNGGRGDGGDIGRTGRGDIVGGHISVPVASCLGSSPIVHSVLSFIVEPSDGNQPINK